MGDTLHLFLKDGTNFELVAFSLVLFSGLSSLITGSSFKSGKFLFELFSETEDPSSSSSIHSFSISSLETNASLGFYYGSSYGVKSSRSPEGTIFSRSSEHEFELDSSRSSSSSITKELICTFVERYLSGEPIDRSFDIFLIDY